MGVRIDLDALRGCGTLLLYLDDSGAATAPESARRLIVARYQRAYHLGALLAGQDAEVASRPTVILDDFTLGPGGATGRRHEADEVAMLVDDGATWLAERLAALGLADRAEGWIAG